MERTTEHIDRQVLARAVRRGALLRASSPLTLTLTGEFLQGLLEALIGSGRDPLEPLYQIGFHWGSAWLQRLEAAVRQYGAALQDVSLDEVQLLLHEELARAGWGLAAFDLESHAEHGLLLVSLTGGPVALLEGAVAEGMAMLQAGFMASVFGGVADLPMAGLGFRLIEDHVPICRVVVAHEARIARIWGVLEGGGSWDDALAAA